MKIAIYPGSFDPITLGHMDIIRRAAQCFDQVPNVAAEHYTGLLAQYARDKGACVLVKGLRNATDFDQEYQMASINRGILPGLETVFLPASPAYQHFSSTMVREMLRYGQPMEQYVPAPVAAQWKGRS